MFSHCKRRGSSKLWFLFSAVWEENTLHLLLGREVPGFDIWPQKNLLPVAKSQSSLSTNGKIFKDLTGQFVPPIPARKTTLQRIYAILQVCMNFGKSLRDFYFHTGNPEFELWVQSLNLHEKAREDSAFKGLWGQPKFSQLWAEPSNAVFLCEISRLQHWKTQLGLTRS